MGWRKQDKQTQRLYDNVTKSLLAQSEARENATSFYPQNDLPLQIDHSIPETYLTLIAPIGAIGNGIVKSLGWIGEKMMPSAFLKGFGQVFPKLAKVTKASPYLDAGVLSYWGAKGIQEAKEAAKSGDVAGAIAGASMAALPLMGINPEVAQELTATQKANKVARALNKEVKGAEIADSPVTQNILAGKLGWAPRQSRVIWHNSESPISKLESTFPAWDIVKRDAPLGHVWGTSTETNLGFIGKRPFHLRSTKPVEMNKPMVQLNESVGNGKNAVRNEILKYADQSGADAVNFSNIKDNTLSNQDVYAVFKDVDVKPKLSEAERLGITKGERNQIVKPNPNAGAESQINTYAINRAYDPWEIKDGKFVFKMGKPIATRGDYSEVKTPVTFHFTTDTQVKPHSGMDSWANAKTTYMVPWKSIVKYNGQPANIEPMDTWWTAGSTFEFPTKDVKVLTADPKTYRQYKLQGVDVEFSPEGRKSIQEGTGMRDIVEDWIRKVQDKTGMRPTTDTYRLMEQETGLRSGVTGKKIQSPWSSFIQEETNIPEYYDAPPTHSNSWSADSMTPIHWFGDKEVQNSNFINSLVKNVANDLDSYGTFTEKDLPALQKLVQNNKVFDKQLPITYGRYGQYEYNYTGKEELVDKINRILRGEIVIPYKQGGILKAQKGTPNNGLPHWIKRDDSTRTYITAFKPGDKDGRTLLRNWQRGDGKQLIRDSTLVKRIGKDGRYIYIPRSLAGGMSGGLHISEFTGENKDSDEFIGRLRFIGMTEDGLYEYYDPLTGQNELYDTQFENGGKIHIKLKR